MRRLAALAALLLAAVCPAQAQAGSDARYGIQDDAWILYGPGRLSERLDTLDRLGVDVVRFTLHWNEIQPARGVFRWRLADGVLRGLRTRGIQPVVTLVDAPGWANGGRAPRFAPPSGKDFAAFATAAARRYRFVRHWTIWNEPNLRRWLEPTNPGTYVRRLLNPAYAAIHRVNPRARVAGGVTAPRSNVGGLPPVDWLRGMARAGAKLDAYAHHPHPSSPAETPYSGGCVGARCKTITMANVALLMREVKRAWGTRVRVWLTEYGYQTDPPDEFLGVSRPLQAQYLADAARRIYLTPRLDMLIQYLYMDEPQPERFQSGLVTVAGRPKPALYAFPFPLTQTDRAGGVAKVWGQIRPRTGKQSYRLQLIANGRKTWLTPVRRTNARGTYAAAVRVPPGATVRVWSVRDRRYGAPLLVR